jgi:enediyne core biosynthesis thioesterase
MKEKFEMPMITDQDGGVFEYRFITTFEETNVVGNIYFANYARWQGKCREMFLKEYCPTVIQMVREGLALITLDLNLRFVSQLFAFDDVVIRMGLGSLGTSRMMMTFKYFRVIENVEELVCEGSQAMACMKMDSSGKMVAVPIPEEIHEIFAEYGVEAINA